MYSEELNRLLAHARTMIHRMCRPDTADDVVEIIDLLVRAAHAEGKAEGGRQIGEIAKSAFTGDQDGQAPV